MNSVVLEVMLGIGNFLDVSRIVGFYLTSDVDSALPYGFIEYSDESGREFAEFKSLAVGSQVRISAFNEAATKAQIEAKDPSALLRWPEFVLLGVENDCTKDFSNLAGVMTIWFGHPWFAYRDPSNRCYPPMNSSELLKKILKDETRGVAFDVDDDFDKTDDAGRYPRYKTKDTDFSFVYDKVVPYCSVRQAPVHLFSDDAGRWKLKSFESMYSETPIVMFAPPGQNMSASDIEDAIKVAQRDGFNDPTAVLEYVYANVTIGGGDYVREAFPTFSVEDPSIGSALSGGKIPGNQLKSSGGSSFGGLLPLDVGFMARNAGTTHKVVANRQLIDSLSLLFAGSSVLDYAFVVRVDTDFCGDKAKIGKTASLYVPSVKYPATQTESGKPEIKKHWANGKWLCKRVVHYLSADSARRMLTSTFLVRSAFVGDEGSTSIKQPDLLYKVVV